MDFKEELKGLVFVEKLKLKIRKAVKQNQDVAVVEYQNKEDAHKAMDWIFSNRFPKSELTNDNVIQIYLEKL